MIRLFHVYFPTRTLVLALAEALLIVLALLAATVARSSSEAELWLVYEYGFLKIAIVSVTCMLCMYYYDLYDSIVLGSLREALTRLVQVLGTVCLILALLYYAFPAVRLGRGSFLMGIALVALLLGTSRKVFLTLNRSSRLAERAIVLGAGSLAASLSEEVKRRPELGVRLLGFVSSEDDLKKNANGLRHLGDIKELPTLIERQRITRIIVAQHDRRCRALPTTELYALEKRGVIILDGALFYEIVTGKVFVNVLQPSWRVLSPGFRVSPALLFYKRAISIFFSVLGLIIALPALGLIALAIRLDSEGPVIFRQQRVGKDGKLFTLYKFRTMRNGASLVGQFRPAQENDERCTRVGRWLRRTRLDELPQLYNVLRGDMYFVGPRPFAQEEEESLAQQIPFYAQRWTVKPGATGWAQVHRAYCASLEDNAEKLAYDLFYIKNMSMGLDLLILFQTTKILLLGRGAR